MSLCLCVEYMLNLSEIFCSIQGESSYAGLPCIFIRLAGCNLRCKYCDTTYSYETNFSKSIDEIVAKIIQYSPIKLVEITGGEPLLQKDTSLLFEELIKNNFQILLETNGSISLKNVPPEIVKIVDVKTPGSNCEDSFLLENLSYIHPAKDEIKFVLCNRSDYDWANDFIRKHKLKKLKILFSVVTDNIEPKVLAEWIIEDRLPVRMQLQLHKYIWDKDKRGV